jgi:hypothetical protein
MLGAHRRSTSRATSAAPTNHQLGGDDSSRRDPASYLQPSVSHASRAAVTISSRTTHWADKSGVRGDRRGMAGTLRTPLVIQRHSPFIAVSLSVIEGPPILAASRTICTTALSAMRQVPRPSFEPRTVRGGQGTYLPLNATRLPRASPESDSL